MSRLTLLLALLISVAAHGWLLSLPPRKARVTPPIVIPVIETDLARPQPPPPPEAPAPDQTPPEVAEPPPDPPAPPADLPPQPPLEKVAEAPAAETDVPGDFAGKADGSREPELRINWGTIDEALAALDAGEMVIVVLRAGGAGPLIKSEIEPAGGTWRRRGWQPRGSMTYSNRLRIVDQVPAFGPVREAVELRDDERLAVLVPTRVERVLESAQIEAAYRQGLAMQQIDNFAGRFLLRDGTLQFDITHVSGIERSAMP